MVAFKKSKSEEHKSTRAKSARAQEQRAQEQSARKSEKRKSEFTTMYFFFLFLLPVDDVYDPVHRADVFLQYRGVHTPPLHTHHL